MHKVLRLPRVSDSQPLLMVQLSAQDDCLYKYQDFARQLACELACVIICRPASHWTSLQRA